MNIVTADIAFDVLSIGYNTRKKAQHDDIIAEYSKEIG
jgi:hypothetical protein